MRPRGWRAAWSVGVEQVGLWWPHGAHVPGHLPRIGPQDPPPAKTSSPTPTLPPALIGSLAIWKHEHRGLFRRSPVLQYSLHPHWREREKQDPMERRNECENSLNLILNDSWNTSPKCLHLHSGTLSAFVRGCTMLNDVASVQCSNWLVSWKSGLENMFIGRNAATGDGRTSLYCIVQLLVTPAFIGPLFLFFLTKGDFFLTFWLEISSFKPVNHLFGLACGPKKKPPHLICLQKFSWFHKLRNVVSPQLKKKLGLLLGIIPTV